MDEFMQLIDNPIDFWAQFDEFQEEDERLFQQICEEICNMEIDNDIYLID